jgi:Ser/Thr protein kinase RdoA (MazF antagonist)
VVNPGDPPDRRRRWIAAFDRLGYPAATPLASGMEGHVFRLADDRIGKVWFRRTSGQLRVLRDFYADLLSAHLPFATPHILTIHEAAGYGISIEQALPGEPLAIDEQAPRLASHTVDALLGVLRALRGIAPTPAMRQLPVLDEAQPPWEGALSWADAMDRLIVRRVARSAALLRAAVPDFDHKVAALRAHLHTLPAYRDAVFHGDLVPQNLLLDGGRVAACIDFGFLSGIGDPRFDAAIASSIFNMYGRHAREVDRQLTTAVVEGLGDELEVLLVYKAIYAVVTCTAYDPAGRDGHFRWCAQQLQRADVSEIL